MINRKINGEEVEMASNQKCKVTFRHADEKRLRELGLWNVDELVISLGKSRIKSVQAAKKKT